MFRSFVAALVALAMLWQSAPVASVAAAQSGLADAAHAVLHWSDLAHHHHDDGTHHFDDSPESAQHLIADHFSNPSAMPGEPAITFAPAVALSPPHGRAGGLPAPFLEGPLRPPRPTA